MKRLVRFVATAALGLLFVAVAAADTLELKDGRILQGRYLGGTQAVLRFEIEGNVQACSVTDVVAVTSTRGGGAAAAAPTYAPAPAPAPVAQAQPVAAGGTVTIPAGQSILVRMIDGVDSSKNHVGDIFHASLETDLTVNGALVARKGTDVYGRLAEAKEAGHIAGSSVLQLELMRIVVHGHDYSAVSSEFTLQGKGRGSNTAKKVGGGAALGAIIGAVAGGGKG